MTVLQAKTSRPMTFTSRYKNTEKLGLWTLSGGGGGFYPVDLRACHIMVLN